MQKDARAYYANMTFPNSILQIHSVILVIARPPISSLHPFLVHSICGRLFCQFNVVFMDFLLVHTPSTDVSLQLHLEAENDECEHHSWRKTCFSFRCNSVLYKECPRGIFSSVHRQNVLTRYLSRPVQSKYLVSKYSRQSAKSYQQKKGLCDVVFMSLPSPFSTQVPCQAPAEGQSFGLQEPCSRIASRPAECLTNGRFRRL
jgi:hypothetical protein